MDKESLSLIKDLPYVIALCLFGWLIIRTVIAGIVKLFEIWREATKERNAIEQRRAEIDNRRNDLDEKIAEIVSNNGKLISSVVGRLEKLVEGDVELKTAVVEGGKAVLIRMDKQDEHLSVAVENLKLVRDQQYALLQERLDVIQKKLEIVTDDTLGLPKVVAEVQTITAIVSELKKLIEESKLT